MAEDWDLQAVVRSCKAAATTKNAITATTSITSTAPSEDPLACLASLTFEEENDPFSFPGLVEPRTTAFQELQELCKSFFPTTTTTSSHSIDPNSFLPDIQRRRHPVRPTTTSSSLGTHFKPGSFSSSGFGEIQGQQRRNAQEQQQQRQDQPYPQRQVQQQKFQRPQANPAMSLPTMQSETPRSRKRKSQQKRTVCHVTADNLSADVWAWRKYGQKPIKGSPYPRNYYRCSSSKGCAARKQVERSNIDPNIFIITYTGEHTHPRPTHRNSLAGSTRNKCSAPHKSIDKENSSPSTANIGSCSSPQSASSLSPTTPLTDQTDEEATITNKNNNEGEDKTMVHGTDKDSEEMADYVVDDNDDDDEDEILIPNMTMSQDIFMGLQELGYSSPGGGSGDNFSDGGQANSGSSWAPCDTAAALTTIGTGMDGC